MRERKRDPVRSITPTDRPVHRPGRGCAAGGSCRRRPGWSPLAPDRHLVAGSFDVVVCRAARRTEPGLTYTLPIDAILTEAGDATGRSRRCGRSSRAARRPGSARARRRRITVTFARVILAAR
jgi:hypothetical protein